MRKFLWVVAVGALVLALAAPAMALDFKFGSEYRVRFTTGVNNPLSFTAATAASGDNAGTNVRSVQLRVRPRFDVSDDNGNMTATLRLEIGDVEFGNGGGAVGETNAGFTSGGTRTGTTVGSGSARVGNGSGGGFGADGVNVETKWGYIDFALPFGLPARVRAGIQPWFLPKGLILDDDGAGLRAYGTVKPVSYELFWFRTSGGPNTAAALGSGAAGQVVTSNTTDNNYDFYGGRIDVAIAPWLNPGVYYLFGDNRLNCTTSGTCPGVNRTRESHYVGLTATGKFGIVSYDLDWVYGSAEGGQSGAFPTAAAPIDVKGWALDGAVHFPIGPVTVNLAGAYGTGDRANGGASEAFPSIAASWNGAGGGFEMIGSGGPFDQVEFTQDSPTNLWMLGGWVTYNPVKALTLKTAYGYAGFVKKNGNCTTGGATCYGPRYETLQGKSGVGQELSFRADYDIWTGFKIQGQMGWLFTRAGSNKTAAEYVLQMYYNF